MVVQGHIQSKRGALDLPRARAAARLVVGEHVGFDQVSRRRGQRLGGTCESAAIATVCRLLPCRLARHAVPPVLCSCRAADSLNPWRGAVAAVVAATTMRAGDGRDDRRSGDSAHAPSRRKGNCSEGTAASHLGSAALRAAALAIVVATTTACRRDAQWVDTAAGRFGARLIKRRVRRREPSAASAAAVQQRNNERGRGGDDDGATSGAGDDADTASGG